MCVREKRAGGWEGGGGGEVKETEFTIVMEMFIHR